jgi:type II secretory pathway pseudopilin PulG
LLLRGRGRRPRSTTRAGCQRGYSLIELLLAISFLVLLTAMAVPWLTSGLERARARAAARYLATRMARIRTQAVTRSTTIALRFEASPAGLLIAVYGDGNGNGVRTRDIDGGIDRSLEPAVRLEDLFPGVLIAAAVGNDGPAVDLGGADLLSFTPFGTATSGTISILGRDGSQFAVRVLGSTARIRLLRFDPLSRQWVESY